MRTAVAGSALFLFSAGGRSRHLGSGAHSTRAEILAIPLAAQAGGSDGGIACLGLLLRYHGSSLDLEAQDRFAPAEHVTAVELRDYLRGRGFAAEMFGGDLGAQLPRGLLGYIERGHPAILALEDRFVLAYGFDPVARLVFVDDPLVGRRELDYDALERLWRTTGRLLLVAAPRASLSSSRPPRHP
jgi:ABC-type bacteriocin/lantibiotic exporter with double-glycine peptidase domain